MDDDQKTIVTILVVIFVGTMLVCSVCMYGAHVMKLAKYENFQKTIGNLSEEQKCLHICGFQYPGGAYFDNYKYCVEKCDCISERTLSMESCLK